MKKESKKSINETNSSFFENINKLSQSDQKKVRKGEGPSSQNWDFTKKGYHKQILMKFRGSLGNALTIYIMIN
jgi:hypothetical protein